MSSHIYHDCANYDCFDCDCTNYIGEYSTKDGIAKISLIPVWQPVEQKPVRRYYGYYIAEDITDKLESEDFIDAYCIKCSESMFEPEDTTTKLIPVPVSDEVKEAYGLDSNYLYIDGQLITNEKEYNTYHSVRVGYFNDNTINPNNYPCDDCGDMSSILDMSNKKRVCEKCWEMI